MEDKQRTNNFINIKITLNNFMSFTVLYLLRKIFFARFPRLDTKINELYIMDNTIF